LSGVNAKGEAPRRGERVFKLDPEALNAFLALRKAAAEAGFDDDLFTLSSAYRNQAHQQRLAAQARAKHGGEAGKWVAQEHSEHITGRAFDLNLGPRNDSRNAQNHAFDNLRSFRWLQENADKFGLNPYEAEPWHWSYNVQE
jgi:LAS superfamily LD-carboxypeptidase LdcB